MWIPDRLSSGCVLAPNTLDILETYTTLLVKMGATLDALTGGRFILGIGACWCQEEYRRYGYNYPTPAVRIRQLEEGLEIVKRLWTEDDVTFKGKYFKVENTYCYQKPDPLPPIMIASVGERLSIRLVAKYADWWNIPIPSVDLYKHKLAVVKDHCEKIGRDPDELVKTQFHMVTMAETDEEAKKKAFSFCIY